jgi:branched-chain amino acid transport system permease protein
MSAPSRTALWLALAAVVVLACLPQFAERYYVQLFTRIMIEAIFAMSLGLLISGAGLVSLGHAMFFGLGAYLLVLLTPDDAGPAIWWALPAVIVGTAAAAFLIGALAVRTGGIYFIMLTLAFGEMLFYLFHDAKFAGGSDGVFVNFRPTVEWFGHPLLSLDDRPTLFYVVLALMVLTYLGINMLLNAPFGRAVLGIRVNEARMRALGYNTYAYKLVAFAIAGAVAGLAGFLYVAQYRVVNPELFSWRESGLVLMMVILGGLRSRLGAAIGAFAFVLIEEVLQAITGSWLLLLGVFIIVAVLLLPNGLAALGASIGLSRQAKLADD